MDINYKEEDNKLTYSDLEEGDVFRFSYDSTYKRLYMKCTYDTRHVDDRAWAVAGGSRYVSLEDGDIGYAYRYTEEVIKVIGSFTVDKEI